MNFEAIEEYLIHAAKQEKENLRPLIVDPRVDYATRRYAWSLMEEFTVFLNGFLYCIAICESVEKAQYYKEFYDQARSRNGLNGEST